MKRIIKHLIFIVVILGLLPGLPIATHFDIFQSNKADAVSGASVDLPDQPSGTFLVLVNRDRHRDSLEAWRQFFTGQDLPVIFDDIHCLVSAGDAGARQMADRYRAQLPENQMMVREENPTLFVSKAEAGYIDVAVISREMADALDLAGEGGLAGLVVFQVEGVGD